MAGMRFGVFVPQGWRMDLVGIGDPVQQFEAMMAVAKAADAGPWDGIWVYDHLHTVPEPTLETTFECWTISATLARDTSRVRIGQLREAGADYLIVYLPGLAHDHEQLQRFQEEIIPHFAR